MSRRNSLIFSLLLAIVLLAAGAVHAQEDDLGAAPPAPNEEPGSNDEQMSRTDMGNVTQSAMASFHAGRRSLSRAEKLADKIEETEPAKREKARAKAEKAYEEAVGSFLEAVRTKPDLVEAYAELGGAFRWLGKNAEAIQVYSKALSMEPGDPETRYGRAEAFLALNYLREAATAYTELTAESHREHAERLMGSMKQWVAAHREDPGAIKPEAVETLGAWIEQQESSSG